MSCIVLKLYYLCDVIGNKPVKIFSQQFLKPAYNDHLAMKNELVKIKV